MSERTPEEDRAFNARVVAWMDAHTKIVRCAVALFANKYDDLGGPGTEFPPATSRPVPTKQLFALRDALRAAGYEWETLT